MRSLILCFFLAAVWTWTDARAQEADEAAFRYAIFSHMREHPMTFPADLMDRRAEIDPIIGFSIDHDGKLLDAQMVRGSGSTQADQDILDWLRRLQPFPRVPTTLLAPVKFSEMIALVPTSLESDVRIKWVAGASASVHEAAFQEQVAARLQRQPRTYTEEMKDKHGLRRAVVTLLIDQDGRLLNVEMTRESGAAKVDEETLAWLEAAQPYPQIPADLKAPVRLTAEIAFGPPPKEIWNDEGVKRAIGNVCKGC
jgi:TonB family protein